jgi:hypothetical protein
MHSSITERKTVMRMSDGSDAVGKKVIPPGDPVSMTNFDIGDESPPEIKTGMFEGDEKGRNGKKKVKLGKDAIVTEGGRRYVPDDEMDYKKNMARNATEFIGGNTFETPWIQSHVQMERAHFMACVKILQDPKADPEDKKYARDFFKGTVSVYNKHIPNPAERADAIRNTSIERWKIIALLIMGLCSVIGGGSVLAYMFG